MSEKSHVTLESQVCAVCGKTFDTGALLLDRRLRPIFERKTCTGIGLCPEHEQLYRQGYIALVECDLTKSGVTASTQEIKPEQAYRTGRLVHLTREEFNQFFDIECPPAMPMVYVEPGVIERLAKTAGQMSGVALP